MGTRWFCSNLALRTLFLLCWAAYWMRGNTLGQNDLQVLSIDTSALLELCKQNIFWHFHTLSHSMHHGGFRRTFDRENHLADLLSIFGTTSHCDCIRGGHQAIGIDQFCLQWDSPGLESKICLIRTDYIYQGHPKCVQHWTNYVQDLKTRSHLGENKVFLTQGT